MYSHLAIPRRGHLYEVLQIFSYMKCHAKSKMVYDPSRIEFDKSYFPRKGWSYYIYTQYGCGLSENLPPNIPKPSGKGIVVMVYFDSDHAGDTFTTISRMRFVIFLNYALIYWISEK